MSSKTRILILGDELGLAEPLQSAFAKEGHIVERAVRPDDAFSLLTQKKFDIIFVDCMLAGGMNGVDFIVHVRENFPQVRARYVLMSGIFTDKAFIKESVERTKAIAFVAKSAGMDLAPFLKLVKARGDEPSEAMAPARKRLYQMFAKETVSLREKRKIIESLDEVSGFDLPFILSLLVETGSSGYLNIYEKNSAVSGITLSQGAITGVDVEDQTTYLGEMLVQSGYVLPADVDLVLQERNSQRIGHRLIHANLLSPHAFDLVLNEQMNIRLSRTIADRPVRINFAIAEVEKSIPFIDSESLQYYLHDWVASKLTTPWLKALYILWAGNSIQVSPTFRPDHPALQMGLVKALPGFPEWLQKMPTLNQLLEEKVYPEAALYKGLHFLMTKGLIIFGAKMAFRSDAEQQAALRKIWNDIQGKSHFEIVDLLGAENVQGEGLATLLGPKPRESAGPTGLLWQNLKTKLEEAARRAGDLESRAQFRQDAAGKEAEARMQASQRVEEARQALGLNHFSKALVVLNELQKTQPNTDSLHLLLAWAKLGVLEPSRKAAQLKDIEFELVQVPAEERYDAHYPFVLGLLHRAKGDLVGARKHLERAVALNSSLMAARRELSAVEAQVKKEADLFGGVDLKGLVGGLFRRK